MTDEWRGRMKEIKAKASFGYVPQFRAEQRMSGCAMAHLPNFSHLPTRVWSLG
jgi:hypothetical protein